MSYYRYTSEPRTYGYGTRQTPPDNSFRRSFLMQLWNIDLRPSVLVGALGEMLGTQEGVTIAMSLTGEDALILVNVLDQVLDAPEVPSNLRETSTRILLHVCSSQAILPHSCILTDDISKEGNVARASSWSANVWKGRHNGSHVCIKVLPTAKIQLKGRLFREIVLWRRLSHPNILPVLGVAPKLFPFCIITEWMENGNIMDFVSKHPDVNRLRLLAGAASGLHYLHSTYGVHGNLKATNILIDHNSRPLLTDCMTAAGSQWADPPSTNYTSYRGRERHRFTSLLSKPPAYTQLPASPVVYSRASSRPSSRANSPGPTESTDTDINALGTVIYHVLTGQQPFPEPSEAIPIIMHAGESQGKQLGPNEWISEDVWSLISLCWSSDPRPNAKTVMEGLEFAADAVEMRKRKLAEIDSLWKRTSRQGSVRVQPPNTDPSRPPAPPPKSHATLSPFIVRAPAGSRATQKERKKHKLGKFRVWCDSTGLHQQEAALVGYNDGIAHLSATNGTLLEIPEVKLSPNDLTYIQSQDVYKKAQKNSQQSISAVVLFIHTGLGLKGHKGTPQLNSKQQARVIQSHSSPRSQVYMQDTTPQSSQVSTISVAQLQSLEEDVIAFLSVCDPGTESNLERKKAQEFADRLDLALVCGDLHQQKQKHYLKYLRKLCGSFGILPSSFFVKTTLDESGATPFALGGFSDVYKATFEGRSVVAKSLRVTNAGNLKQMHKLLAREVVGWKWLQHQNILQFIGVTFAPPLFLIISEYMENGNIMHFIKTSPDHNRLHLLIGTVTGLEYLHGCGIIHGDVKGANILIDSHCHARLSDFGLVAVINESEAASTINNSRIGGTTRWMAPELMHPGKFGFTKECRVQLPSIGSDIYALGITILEVITGCRPFHDILVEAAVMYKVIEGGRPDRPPSGFTDPLWELLVETWREEHGSRSPKRPETSTILNKLRKEADNWGKTIIPPPAGWNVVDRNPTITTADTIPFPLHSPRADPDSVKEFSGLGISWITNKHPHDHDGKVAEGTRNRSGRRMRESR